MKQFLSLTVIIFFAFLALGSTVNKVSYNAFNYSNKVEEKSEKGNYLLKDDGTKIYGDKIKWQSGLLLKDKIEIDGQKFRPDEIVGYRQGDIYYGRMGSDYIRRILHGKINIYVIFTEVTTDRTDRNGFTTTSKHIRAAHYAQKGEYGPILVLAGQDEIKELVSDCPLALEMASLTDSQMRKALKKDRNYLNSIFETYNNNFSATKREE